LRYEILYRHGGVYVDIDFECLKPLKELVENFDFFSCLIPETDVVANGIIGSIPGHPILRDCINRIKYTTNILDDFDDIMLKSGPDFFTISVENYLKLLADPLSLEKIILLGSNYFFPFPSYLRFDFKNNKFTRRQARKFAHSESFGIHYWANTWIK
jgi:mannosyltransferase OCH1-like enzyme